MAITERAALVPAESVRLAASVAALAHGAAPALAQQKQQHQTTQQEQQTSRRRQGMQRQGAARQPEVVNR